MNDKKLAQVFHYDLYGKREEKYEFLNTNSFKNIDWINFKINNPNFFLKVKDLSGEIQYNQGFKINEIFDNGAGGIASHRDSFVIDNNLSALKNRISDFYNLAPEIVKARYELEDTDEWQVSIARKAGLNLDSFTHISYRPFDARYIYYDDNLITRSRRDLMQHFLYDNVGFVTCKRQENVTIAFITKFLIDQRYFSVPGSVGKDYAFPLYLYLQSDGTNTINLIESRTPNLNPQIVQQLAGQLGLTFTPEKEPTPNTFAPIDILDYIYAILHSPTYRAKYKEFLKIDFPRIPYPKDQETFWKFVNLGRELRQIHLLESPVVEKFITSYPVSGTNEVGKVRYEDKKVWINEVQYFDHVPQVAWEFYIGGYQPAQKWLKDRKGRQLSFEDVRHYQKIIVALTETDRIMGEIDKVEFE